MLRSGTEVGRQLAADGVGCGDERENGEDVVALKARGVY